MQTLTSRTSLNTLEEIAYTSNDLVVSIGKVIEVPVKEEDLSTVHPVPPYDSGASPKIIVKLTRWDVRNASYANRRKMKTHELPDLRVDRWANTYISESRTPYEKKLFGEVIKVKKWLEW